MANFLENIPLPDWIQAKNAKIADIAIAHTKVVVGEMPQKDMTKIGLELIVKRTDTMDKYISKIGGLTVNDAMKLYMPEILALTVGSALLGSVIGYNWTKIVKVLK